MVSYERGTPVAPASGGPGILRRARASEAGSCHESGPLRAVHLPRHKWPGGAEGRGDAEAGHAILSERCCVCVRKVDERQPRTGNSNSHGARLVHLIITMIKLSRTSKLSINHSLCHPEAGPWLLLRSGVWGYRGYSKLRTRTALGSYSRDMPRGIGSP